MLYLFWTDMIWDNTTDDITVGLEKLCLQSQKMQKTMLRTIITKWPYENDQQCKMETEKVRKQTKDEG